MASLTPRHAAALALLALAPLRLLPACDPVDPGNRKCYDEVPAFVPSDDKSCGVPTKVRVQLCERLPESRCNTQQPTYLCLSSPYDTGYLIQLSPCGELESLPEGWAIGDDYITGVKALPQCKVARNLCDGTTIPFVAKDEQTSAGGQGGSGQAGSGQAGSGGSDAAGAAGSQGGSDAAGSGG